MNRFLIYLQIFIFFYIAAATSAETASSFTQEIVSLAKEYRIDTTLPGEIEAERTKKILEIAYEFIPSYASLSSLELAVQQFVTDTLSNESMEFSLISAAKLGLEGKSHDPVFMILDPRGQLCYIVKAFRNPRESKSKFLPEISALTLLKQLHLSGVACLDPIAFATYSSENGEWGMILESAAKGTRMDQYVLHLSKQDSAIRAFNRMGQSLAMLHAIQSSSIGTLTEETLSKYENKLTKLLNNHFIVDELSLHFPISDFIDYIHTIYDSAVSAPVSLSYRHGDPNLGNLFYDEVQDEFSFIDVAKMHHSVDINGQPLVDGTIDLLKVEEHVRKISLGILKEDEINKLLTAFYEGYEKELGQLPDERLLLFHQTYLKLGRLTRYSRYNEEMDPVKQASEKAIFESAIDYFKIQLSEQLK